MSYGVIRLKDVAITGRKFVAGARRGYVGTDVLLGAASMTVSLVPTGNGSDNFGWPINANEVGCGWFGNGTTADSIYYGKFNINTNTYSGTFLVAGGVPANARQFTAANTNQNVAVAWWVSTAGTEALVYTESTNNGTTFGSQSTVMQSGFTLTVTVMPWFCADMIYKPGSTNLYMAYGTLEPGAFGTVRGYKLMIWSPSLNGGTPVKVVDRSNFPPMADTNVWNDRTRLIQVGMLAMSHPGLAFSSNGSRLFVVYSGEQLDTASYGYNFNDIYEQYSDDNGATWSAPRNLTNTPAADEIYPSISYKDNTPTVISITNQLSECPGSTSFTNTATPICKVYQIYRKYDPVTGAVIGIKNVSTEVPAGFSLMQNYPNPFNPSTKIRFAIPKTSNVTIEVYDITGKLVATLARNESVSPGVKEVEFDGSNLASGIYLYTLKAGEFLETKKMILVK